MRALRAAKKPRAAHPDRETASQTGLRLHTTDCVRGEPEERCVVLARGFFCFPRQLRTRLLIAEMARPSRISNRGGGRAHTHTRTLQTTIQTEHARFACSGSGVLAVTEGVLSRSAMHAHKTRTHMRTEAQLRAEFAAAKKQAKARQRATHKWRRSRKCLLYLVFVCRCRRMSLEPLCGRKFHNPALTLSRSLFPQSASS